MKRYTMSDIPQSIQRHALERFLPGRYIYAGGLSIMKPGERAHDHDGPDGCDVHVHDDCEVFVILQGKGAVEFDGYTLDGLRAGDVVVIEPGENHHLVSDLKEPCICLWAHANDQPPA